MIPHIPVHCTFTSMKECYRENRNYFNSDQSTAYITIQFVPYPDSPSYHQDTMQRSFRASSGTSSSNQPFSREIVVSNLQAGPNLRRLLLWQNPALINLPQNSLQHIMDGLEMSSETIRKIYIRESIFQSEYVCLYYILIFAAF